MKKYMFDTNIFNHIINGSIETNLLHGRAEFFATDIQHSELLCMDDSDRKNAIIGIFKLLTCEIPTESFVLDVSRLDTAKLGSDSIPPIESTNLQISGFDEDKWCEQNFYDAIKTSLDKSNNNKKNNDRDALIAETALKNKITLVTHDSLLFKVATQYRCSCANLYQILKEIS